METKKSTNKCCKIYEEQIKLLLSLPNQEEAKNVLYQAVINSYNQFENQNENQTENQNENAYISLSILSISILNLLSKNIVWKEYNNNYGGSRENSGRKKVTFYECGEPENEKSKEKYTIDYDTFIERWNRNASRHDNFIAVRMLNDTRKKNLNRRFDDLKKNNIEPTIDSFFKEIGNAYMSSGFLRGEKNGFNFTLDFVLQASSFQKILEGGYKDCQ